MSYALFLGCTIPARLQHYEVSARSVLEKLDIELIDIPDFNCCGYPIKNYDYNSFLLSSARNISLAEDRGLDIVTLCKCCYGSLKKAEHTLNKDQRIKDEITSMLKKDNLKYSGNIKIKHLLSVLYHDVGLESIKEKIVKPYNDINIATHYGCHALRPSDIVQFDDPENPTLFDQLVDITGARSINWSRKLECCGAPQLGVNDELATDMMEKKLNDGKEMGAQYLCVACPYCQLQFDRVQQMLIKQKGETNGALASVLYTQFLGISMGIDPDALQIGMNEIDIRGITYK